MALLSPSASASAGAEAVSPKSDVPTEAARAARAERTEVGLEVTLFGRLCVACHEVPVERGMGSRVQELFCYLLLHRRRTHVREALASALWGDQCITKQSKAYLRKALWQLRSSLDAAAEPTANLILTDGEYIRIVPSPALWLDVATLEQAYLQVRDVPGTRLSNEEAEVLRAAVSLYTGDLLEGWYHDWCLVERARLQQIYLLMLDKLMAHCVRVGACEAGLAYGEQSLRYDRARERTYRGLIRLHHGLGDPTGALRVYERCTGAVREELGAPPSAATTALAEAVRCGTSVLPENTATPPTAPSEGDVTARVERLTELQLQLASLQEHVASEIEVIRRALRRRNRRREAGNNEST